MLSPFNMASRFPLRARQPLVHPHQPGDDLRLAQVLIESILRANSCVVGVVGLAKLRGHGQVVVEVGQGAVRVEGPRVQDALGGPLDGGALSLTPPAPSPLKGEGGVAVHSGQGKLL